MASRSSVEKVTCVCGEVALSCQEAGIIYINCSSSGRESKEDKVF